MTDKVIELNVSNKPDKVILHCSGTEDFDHDDPDFDSYGIENAREYHMKVKKFKDVAYHYMIRRTGEIEKGRPEHRNGAHCIGQNKKSIGISYVGSNDPTHEQLVSLCVIFIDLFERYGFEPEDWHGHYEFANTQCPGISIVMLHMIFRYVLKEYFINKL